MLTLLVLSAVSLHAPSEAQVNVYDIREMVWTSKYGSVGLGGEETRKIGKPERGKRAVDITFSVEIKSRSFTGKGGEKWAQGELSDLREPDHGALDDEDRLTERDGVAEEAFPIYPPGPCDVGRKWNLAVNGIDCGYRLAGVEDGIAQISTETDATTPRGKLSRSGFWKVDVASGRLLSWNIHTEVKNRDGSREAIDSMGTLKTPTRQ